jgi:membrane-bound inhibitor of C-type lysozyme
MKKYLKVIILPLVLITLNACHHLAKTPSSLDYHEVIFNCLDGTSTRVQFYTNQDKATLIRNNQSVDLIQQPAASGYWYTNAKVSIRGKGNKMSVEIGRMAAITCHAD